MFLRKFLILTMAVASLFIFTGESFAQPEESDEVEMTNEIHLKAKRIGKQYGYVDLAGNIVIEAMFDQAMSFDDDIALVSKNKKWGYIDKQGKFILQPKYVTATGFSSGLAIISEDDTSRGKEGQFFFINKKGEKVIKLAYGDKPSTFSEGLASVTRGKTCGYINKQGKFIVEPEYKTCKPFKEGLAAVEIFKNGKRSKAKSFDELWGYINKKGNLVIDAQFTAAFDFKNGKANVRTQEMKIGKIDKSGNLITKN